MKNLKLKIKALALVAGTLLLGGAAAQAQNYTNLLPVQVVNGTATGGSIAVNLTPPSQTLLLQSGTITNAPTYTTNIVGGVTNIYNNALTNITTISRFSLDGSNWINWKTNTMNNTNGSPTTAVLSGNIQGYFDTITITPNPLTAGVLKQY